jgi:NAD(P)-dependent dehydrogenase (short-subunit alcohol dehydrogenase family)
MSGILDGRIAIVTGAGRGLGRAYAKALAEHGAGVIVNDLGADVAGHGRDASVAEQVADEIRAAGGRAVADHGDVTDAAACERMVQRAVQELGGLDAVINNAGIIVTKPFAESTLADFRRHWDVHVGGHFNLIKAAWPVLQAQQRGRVVLTESAAGLWGLRGQAAYGSAKGAIHGLMRTLAIEGADHGILVNSIAPGGFTRMLEQAVDDSSTLAQMQQLMPAELVAQAVVWLASDACTQSGQVISAWSGRVARVVIGGGPGLIDRKLTAQRIIEEAATVTAPPIEIHEPADGLDEVQHWIALTMS